MVFLANLDVIAEGLEAPRVDLARLRGDCRNGGNEDESGRKGCVSDKSVMTDGVG
jgi:hypothetical protein